MSYQVIARKWRPQRFAEVTGQEAITRTLQNSLRMGRFHHAYILSGPRGCGKTTTARILAKALNCQPVVAAEPCDHCVSCQEITVGASIDVLEIDAASNTGVDNVRDVIINTIAINPARDRYKIFIIDEVHMLSISAFNALLKTLEEPPPHAIFIMATTELHKLPQTILSRCQHFEFHTIAATDIAARLHLIAEAEQITIAADALMQIAFAGQGSMRDAQSAFDQVISFAGTTIQLIDVQNALGIIDQQLLQQVTWAISRRDERVLIELTAQLNASGYDLRQFCRDLMTHFRNLLILKTMGYDNQVLPILESALPDYQAQADLFTSADLIRFFNLLTTLEQDIKQTTQPRFQLEVGLIKLAHCTQLQDLAELVARLDKLAATLGLGEGSTKPEISRPLVTASPLSRPVAPSAPAPKTATSPQPGSLVVAPVNLPVSTNPLPPVATTIPQPPATAAIEEDKGVKRVNSNAKTKTAKTKPVETQPLADTTTPTVPVSPLKTEPNLEKLPPKPTTDELVDEPVSDNIPKGAVARLLNELENKRKMMLLASLGAADVSITDNTLRVKFPEKSRESYKKVSAKDSIEVLKEAARLALGQSVRVEVLLGDQTSVVDEAVAEQNLRKTIETDPMVQLFLQTFKGELVDVRQDSD